MIPKLLNQITAADIRALIGTAYEGKTYEFKRQIPGKTADDITKLVRAVSSFANTLGGDLLIGIDAKQGLASAITGLASDVLDETKLRLSQLVADHIEPRLPRIDFHTIDCGAEGHVMVIRVQRSWLAPHRVKTNNIFYGRNAAGNYPLDVGELRTAFTLSSTAAERIRAFRTERLIKITAGQTPLPMASIPAIVIHVIPFSPFADGRTLDIVATIANGHVMPLPPGRFGHPNNYGMNLDGLFTYTNDIDKPAHGYAQVFRSGAIEGVSALALDDKDAPWLPGPTFENMIVEAARNYLMLLNDIELPPPVFVLISIVGARGCNLRRRTEFGGGYYIAGPLKEDTIALPEVMIESYPANVPTALKITFNTIWNAFGFAKSEMYDGQGKWIGIA
jgi:hypothetical protein